MIYLYIAITIIVTFYIILYCIHLQTVIKVDRLDYNLKRQNLLDHIQKHEMGTKNNKETTNNYIYGNIHNRRTENKNKKSIPLKNFNNIINVNYKEGFIHVEGNVNMEQIFDKLIVDGYNLNLTTETLDMTVGGAISGIGINSGMHKYGLFHDNLIEIEILLSNGTIITCSENINQDIFYGIANSYGTLGYIISCKLKIKKIKPYIKVTSKRYNNTRDYIIDFKDSLSKNDYVDGLLFGTNELYLITGNEIDAVNSVDKFNYLKSYYLEIKKEELFYMNTKDYLFRYEPDYYWNLGNSVPTKLFKLLCPTKYRRMSFYKKIVNSNSLNYIAQYVTEKKEAFFIQDWVVQYDKSYDFIDKTIRDTEQLVEGKPFALFPIITQKESTLYPLKKNQLYLNLGSYTDIAKYNNDDPYHLTKVTDNLCFKLDGIKMLYSSTFLDKEQFYDIYNGKKYFTLKDKYDAKKHFKNLDEKVLYANQ